MKPPSRDTLRMLGFFSGLVVAGFTVFGGAVVLMGFSGLVTP